MAICPSALPGPCDLPRNGERSAELIGSIAEAGAVDALVRRYVQVARVACGLGVVESQLCQHGDVRRRNAHVIEGGYGEVLNQTGGGGHREVRRL